MICLSIFNVIFAAIIILMFNLNMCLLKDYCKNVVLFVVLFNLLFGKFQLSQWIFNKVIEQSAEFDSIVYFEYVLVDVVCYAIFLKCFYFFAC